MKRLFKFSVYFLIAGMVVVAALKVTNKYIVLDFSETPQIEPFKLVLGDTVQPLLNFDFSKGEWKALVNIAPDDIATLDPKIKRSRCLFTANTVILNSMKENWKFQYSEGDMATVESKFYLFSHGKLVFKCGIVLGTDEQGLQSKDFGWLNSVNGEIINSIENFNKVQFPILFL